MTRAFLVRSAAIICVALGGGGLPSNAWAADVTLHTDAVMSCYLRLDGSLDSGDAAMLDQILTHYDDDTTSRDHPSSPRICLNSEGGDYAAALDIIDRLGGRFSTAIAADDTCAGACALLFMAGRKGDGGTLDSRQGGRIVHPKGTLGFGGPGTTLLDTRQIAQLIALQSEYSIHSDILLAMLEASPVARTLETAAQASLWQIRIGPAVMPDRLSPLAVLSACTNASTPLIDRLRFADDELHNPDWPERGTPELHTSGSGSEVGILPLRINRHDVMCKVSYQGAHSLPAGRVGIVSLTMGGGDGAQFYRSLYGPMLFTPPTRLSRLARQSDIVPEPVAIASRNAPDRTKDEGLCGVISGGELTGDFHCVRTESVIADEALNALTRTTFDTDDGTQIIATATGEYGRSWPDDMEPEFTLDGAPAEYWRDGMPDEGDNGNDPGADTACRIMTDGRSQWCPTSFWRDKKTGDVFLFIADADRKSGLAYASQD